MQSRITLLFTSLLVAFAAAQNFTFDPNSVDLTTKNQWCTSELNTCPSLCGGLPDTSANQCTGATLNYTCTCANGTAPDVMAYKLTLPYYICQASFAQCNTAYPGAQSCSDQFQCASLDASSVPTGVGASSTSSSATATSTSSATATSSTASATAKSFAVKVGGDYGVGAVAAGLAAAVGCVL
ncbi:hypothetical protein MMC12_005131 [Toensbergia leucococca]|nr:hypothetical protein [Toensbergia leucococca]